MLFLTFVQFALHLVLFFTFSQIKHPSYQSSYQVTILILAGKDENDTGIIETKAYENFLWFVDDFVKLFSEFLKFSKKQIKG